MGLSVSAQQTFTDNFDSYSVGSYLCVSNSQWKTWDNKPGSATDVQISNSKAFSGNNSLYFSSVSGGPTDVILPFSAAWSSGSLTIRMRMFVESGKKGYFNIQGDPTPGKEWSFNWETLVNEEYLSTNGNNQGLFNAPFRKNEWNKITLNIDLNTNRWTCWINDSNPTVAFTINNRAGGINFYSMANSSYFVDDVEFEYQPYTPIGTDLAIAGSSFETGLPGQTFSPWGVVRNLGATAISGYVIEATYNGNKIPYTASGKNILSLGYDTFQFSGSFPFDAALESYQLQITQRNGQSSDDKATNDELNRSIQVVKAAPGKFVISEEGTGTWCGWCPRGAVMLDNMHKKYDGYFQGIAVHNGANDPMLVPVYDNGMKSKISGYPSALVDRQTDIDPSLIEAEFLKRVTVAPLSSIKVGTEFNGSNRELKVSLTTKFVLPASGNYRIACVLLEDSLFGTTSGWAQSNYYSGGARGVMGGFEKLPNPVPASKMVYHHVARWIAPGFNGQPNAFSSNINVGDSFVHNFIFNLPWGWRTEKMHVVGFVINPMGEIDNGASVDFAKGALNGFVQGTQVKVSADAILTAPSRLQLFPNPANNILNVALNSEKHGPISIRILDMQGKIVYQYTETISESGSYRMVIPMENMPQGMYLFELIQGDYQSTLRFVKQ